MENKSKKVFFVVIIVLLVVGFVYILFNNSRKNSDAWNTYSNSFYTDYSIQYPNYLNVSESGQNNRRAIISTSNFKVNTTDGTISDGYKIDISVINLDSLDNLFSCNNKESNDVTNCLLAHSETQIVDYKSGEVKSVPINIDGYSGIKYEFISNINKNNNIGVVINKDNKYYLVLVAYKNTKDMELFNKILNSLKFK